MPKLNWELAEPLRGTLTILADTKANIPSRYEHLFCKCTKLIAPTVMPTPITVFFVRSVLKVDLTVQDRIAEYWKNVIIYDLTKMERIKDERWMIVIMLEELVHAYYGTFDEEFVGKTVASIYPRVRFNLNTKRYELLSE